MAKKLFLPVFILLCFHAGAQAQFVIDVGYTGSTLLPNPVRPVIRAFNTYLPDNARPMKRMYYINGFHFGLGTVDQPLNVTLEYNGTFSSLGAKRLVNSANAQYNYILNFSGNAVGPGFNFEAGKRLNIGLAALYNFYSFKKYTTDNSQRVEMARQRVISLKPFFDINMGSREDRVNAVLRFFGNFPLKKADISNVYTTMDPEGRAGLADEDLHARLNNVGISLIIHKRR